MLNGIRSRIFVLMIGLALVPGQPLRGQQRAARDVNVQTLVSRLTDYPAVVGPHMSSTDSNEFMEFAPAISLREAERGSEIGGGWDPHGHTPSDVFTTYDDADFRLGLNAAQTTLSAIAQLAGARVSR